MLGKQGRADAIEAAEEKDLGGVCLGAPSLGVRGCGGPRTPRSDGDPRLRWCCSPCAERAAVRRHVAGPRQLRMGGGVVKSDPAIDPSLPDTVGVRIEFKGPLSRTLRVDPKPTTFQPDQVAAINEDAAPIWWNQVRQMVGAPIKRRGRW